MKILHGTVVHGISKYYYQKVNFNPPIYTFLCDRPRGMRALARGFLSYPMPNLGCTKLKYFTNVPEKFSFTVGAKTKQVKLKVNVTAPGFAFRPYQQQLTVPVKGDSKEVTFTLVPLELGEQAIEIEFFKGATRVGYVLVKTNVKSYSFSENPPSVLSMEDPINGLKNLEKMPVNSNKHTLHVTWIERESKLLYTIYPAKRLGEWEKTIPNIQQQIEDYLRNLNAFLTEVVQQGSPSDEKWDCICFNLQGVGTDLFNMLIPL